MGPLVKSGLKANLGALAILTLGIAITAWAASSFEEPASALIWFLVGAITGGAVGYFGRQGTSDWTKPIVLVPIAAAFFLARHAIYSENEPVELSTLVLGFFTLFFSTFLVLRKE